MILFSALVRQVHVFIILRIILTVPKSIPFCNGSTGQPITNCLHSFFYFVIHRTKYTNTNWYDCDILPSSKALRIQISIIIFPSFCSLLLPNGNYGSIRFTDPSFYIYTYDWMVASQLFIRIAIWSEICLLATSGNWQKISENLPHNFRYSSNAML